MFASIGLVVGVALTSYGVSAFVTHKICEKLENKWDKEGLNHELSEVQKR